MERFAIDEELWAPFAGSNPVVFTFFDGYLDAGRVGATLVESLIKFCPSELLGTFDWDEVHDYRARRPMMLFDTDHWVSVEEPTAKLHVARDGRGTPFLVLRAPEPDQRWRAVVDNFEELFRRLGVSLVVTAHGFPMTLPHTRPTPLALYSNDESLRIPNPRWVDRLEIPGSFAAYLDLHLGQAGFRTLGIGAHVPHYLAVTSFGQAAATVLHQLDTSTGLLLPTNQLDLDAEANLMAIDSDTAGDETAAELLAQLEEQYDRYAEAASEVLPTGDEIAAAVESFLAERRNQPPGDQWSPPSS